MWKKISVGVIVTMLLGTTAMAGNTDRLTMSGSTSVYPLAQDLAQAYNAQHTDKTSFRIGQGGSDVGIQDAATGIVDIGNASRNLKPSEVAYGLVATPIARDAVAVVVNPFNPVRNLTTRQIAGIFNGTITNWSQVGGNNAPINVNSYTASAGSDTLDCFSKHFFGSSGTVVATASQWDSDDRLRQAVAADPNAIGFLSLAVLDDSVQAPSLDGRVVSLDAARSGQYNVIQNFSMVTKGQPTGLVKTFIDWVLSPAGQAIVTQNYLPPQSGQAMIVKRQQERPHRLLRHQSGMSPTGFYSNR
ncbi:phosphate transport system substrate-binding protein [Sporomusaceae bacterium BoRhaA]|uniref:phosphate ABC transporter substrate-binding protein n=1 Tax=Pelorhabdus rhamnosifermentans TaxID=2772457 RepID=UPI001C063963|nr:phosphate ABC transporter substrate-binding protein [Pelorhabdus rhamnosifermentans]MBU2700966.1 phosphate transport system substrate-binding protein [Pelorhabdus rhamnosifermentans]